MAAATAAAAATPRLAACTCQAQARAQALRASSGRRPFSTTSPARVVLTADSLDKNDPRDMKNLQEFKFDDIPFLGHMAIEGDRERLHIMRLIEFQLPEIQKLRRPYKAPTTSQALTIQTAFRSSDPMHPVSRKAVLTTTVGRLVAATGSKLSSKEAQHKLKAIAGPRYDPGSNTLKISSDSYPTVTMNMKWCSDALDRLIEAAADTSDPMTDIPLTTKHAQVKQSKNAHKRRATIADIPKEWLVGLTSGKSQSKEKAVEGGSQKLQLEAGQSEAAPPAVA